MKKPKDDRTILTSDSPAWVTVPEEELVSWVSPSFVLLLVCRRKLIFVYMNF